MSGTGESGPSHDEPNGQEAVESDPAPNSVEPRKQNTGSSANSVSAGLNTVFVYVPFSAVGLLIGHRGKNIRRITRNCGVSLTVCTETRHFPEVLNNAFNIEECQKLKITGSYIAIKNAQYVVFTQLKKEFFNSEPRTNKKFQCIVEILVPSDQIGQIIGRGGWKVNRLELTTGSRIIVPSSSSKNCVHSSSPVFIIGDFKSTQLAQKKIYWILQKVNK